MSASEPSGPLVELVDEGWEDPNSIISRPTWPHRETPFKWHFTDVPMMAQY